eukprot:2576566-Pyramimonas_sp.AAC.1
MHTTPPQVDAGPPHIDTQPPQIDIRPPCRLPNAAVGSKGEETSRPAAAAAAFHAESALRLPQHLAGVPRTLRPSGGGRGD